MPQAYGVQVNGKLDRNTLHSHARGAMVNWLHLHWSPIRNDLTTKQITDLFGAAQVYNWQTNSQRVQLVLVNLTVLQVVDPNQVDPLAVPAGAS